MTEGTSWEQMGGGATAEHRSNIQLGTKIQKIQGIHIDSTVQPDAREPVEEIEHPSQVQLDRNGVSPATTQSKTADSPHRKTEPHKDSTSKEEQTSPKIYWATPALMIIGFILGVGLCIGHHFYYDHFNGRFVGSQPQQAWILRGGSTFGFAVKLSFAITAATAYVQQFWISLRSKEASVAQVDSMFGVVSNAVEFLNLRIWFSRPILALPAIVAWVVPLVAIITPGTLVVESILHNQTIAMTVPQLDFSGGGISGRWGVLGSGRSIYHSLAPRVAQIALATAAQGSILAIDPPAQNSTYELTYHAPGFQCIQASASDTKSLEEVFADSYISWAALYPYNTIANPDLSNIPVDINGQSYGADFYSNGSARLFVYSSYSHGAYTCLLRNISYMTHWTFQEGKQNVEVRRREDLNGVAAPSFGKYVTDREVPYIALMDAIGHILVGQIYAYGGAAEYSQLTTIQATNLNNFRIGSDAKAFGRAIEGVFENITISMLSDTLYQRSSTSSPLTPVLTQKSMNIYVYRPLDLYLAYGIGAAATLVCVVIGMSAMMRSGCAHSNNFSAIVRTTAYGRFDGLVGQGDDGRDPLSEKMGSSVIRFKAGRDGEGGFEVDGKETQDG